MRAYAVTEATEDSTNEPATPNATGLSLSGTVTDRVRRMVPHNNPNTEIVTCTTQDSGNHKFYVGDYSPNGYHNIGDIVNLPVYIKVYTRKYGDPSYTLNIQ